MAVLGAAAGFASFHFPTTRQDHALQHQLFGGFCGLYLIPFCDSLRCGDSAYLSPRVMGAEEELAAIKAGDKPLEGCRCPVIMGNGEPRRFMALTIPLPVF